MIGGGCISISSQGNVVVLSDKAGNDKFEVQDSDGVPIFRVKSNQHVQIKQGRIEKMPAGES